MSLRKWQHSHLTQFCLLQSRGARAVDPMTGRNVLTHTQVCLLCPSLVWRLIWNDKRKTPLGLWTVTISALQGKRLRGGIRDVISTAGPLVQTFGR